MISDSPEGSFMIETTGDASGSRFHTANPGGYYVVETTWDASDRVLQVKRR